MTAGIAVFALVALAALCGLMAWRAHRTSVREINQIGARYGVKRWPGEGNLDYLNRIGERILITGWRR